MDAQLTTDQSIADAILERVKLRASLHLLPQQEEGEAERKHLEEVEAKLDNDSTSAMSFLLQVFGLSAVEKDILHCCVALSLEPELGRVFAAVQPHSGYQMVTEYLVAELFDHPRGRTLPANAPLKCWRLISEHPTGTDQIRLECDPFIRNWLLGDNQIDDPLHSIGKPLEGVQEPLPGWPIEAISEYIQKMAANPSLRLRIIVSGQQGSGRRSFASFVLQRFGLNGFVVDADRIQDEYWKDYYMHVQRQAFLTDRVPVWIGEAILTRRWPQHIYPWLLQFIILEPNEFVAPDDDFIDLRIELPLIQFKERLSLWHKWVPAAALWPRQEFEEMVLRNQSTIGQIVSVGKRNTNDIAEVASLLNADAGRQLGQLAQHMTSDFCMDDLVVAQQIQDGIEDFVFEATARIAFWENTQHQRLFPQGKSLVALFTGSPGTGKSMAAQVIANTLQLDLYRIDLSMIVSKYIGESAKNIERILSRSKNMDVILFFDEADALFGKRTDIKDAHDRYANTDTNYLLQAIENYPGIVLLATNNRSNIDSGFIRRFRYVLNFEKPDANQRFQLWRKMVSELAGLNTSQDLNSSLARLSESVELTGAQIKFAALSAIFSAQKENVPLNPLHLLKGIERELAKEGKGINKQVYQNLLIAV
jgi:hypothetical protein